MNPEEDRQIAKLLSSTTTTGGQGSALRWIKDNLEQDYILDLPASPTSLDGLAKFANATHVDDKLKQRALKILKKYAPDYQP